MAPRRRADSKSTSRAAVPQPGGLTDYLEVSARPLQSLLFLAPLIVAYQVGTFAFATQRIPFRTSLRNGSICQFLS